MSADKPKGPNKPFLGEEELSSELDAWDQMFDNLHEAPVEAAPAEEGEALAGTFEPAEPSSRVPEAALSAMDASRTLDVGLLGDGQPFIVTEHAKGSGLPSGLAARGPLNAP